MVGKLLLLLLENNYFTPTVERHSSNAKEKNDKIESKVFRMTDVVSKRTSSSFLKIHFLS
jgi:hypothetical protein